MKATEAMIDAAMMAGGYTTREMREIVRDMLNAAMPFAPPDDAVTRVLEAAEQATAKYPMLLPDLEWAIAEYETNIALRAREGW